MTSWKDAFKELKEFLMDEDNISKWTDYWVWYIFNDIVAPKIEELEKKVDE